MRLFALSTSGNAHVQTGRTVGSFDVRPDVNRGPSPPLLAVLRCALPIQLPVRQPTGGKQLWQAFPRAVQSPVAVENHTVRRSSVVLISKKDQQTEVRHGQGVLLW